MDLFWPKITIPKALSCLSAPGHPNYSRAFGVFFYSYEAPVTRTMLTAGSKLRNYFLSYRVQTGKASTPDSHAVIAQLATTDGW